MKLKLACVYGLLFCLLTTGAFGQGPNVSFNGIVNNASYAPGTNAVAPGSIVAVFGTGLTDGTSCIHSNGCDQKFDANGHLGTTLAGAQVTINGAPVPLLYATPTQLGVQVPAELSGTSAILQVTVNGLSSTERTFAVAPFSPAIFSVNQQGTGTGVITHADGSLVSSTNPAAPGETVTVWATGLGQVAPPVTTGTKPNQAASTVTKPTVTLAGIDAAVQYSGLSGCCVGLDQINVVVPASVSTGTDLPFFLNIGGQQSNTVTISVAPPSPPPQFTLTVSTVAIGSASGVVTVSPPGPTYPAGTVVTLTAVPVDGSFFAAWAGACSPPIAPIMSFPVGPSIETCTVTMNADLSVTATFVTPTVKPTLPTSSRPVSVQGPWEIPGSACPPGLDSCVLNVYLAQFGMGLTGMAVISGIQSTGVLSANASNPCSVRGTVDGSYITFGLSGNGANGCTGDFSGVVHDDGLVMSGPGWTAYKFPSVSGTYTGQVAFLEPQAGGVATASVSLTLNELNAIYDSNLTGTITVPFNCSTTFIQGEMIGGFIWLGGGVMFGQFDTTGQNASFVFNPPSSGTPPAGCAGTGTLQR